MASAVKDEVIARLEKELDAASFSDPYDDLSYADRQKLKAGKYEALARAKLSEIKRSRRWDKIVAGLGAGLLAMGAVVAALTYFNLLGVAVSSADGAFLFFFTSCMGGAAIGHLWHLIKLERRRVLCEVLVAGGPSSVEETGTHRE